MNTFVISDDSINSYGFRVLTSGIDYQAFLLNPVMLYMHERGEVIGRWENIRVEDGKLLADAILDDTTETAQQVKQQVEKGFLRSASIGIDIQERKIIDNEQVVTACKLIEVSIVDVPSNQNAIKLYNKFGKSFPSFSAYLAEESETLKTALIRLLGLENDATEEDIVEAVENLVNAQKDGLNDVVSDALSFGCFDDSHKDFFAKLAKSDFDAFDNLVKSQKAKDAAKVSKIINDAICKGLISKADEPIFKEIGLKLGSGTLSRLSSTWNAPIKPTDFINLPQNKSSWNLEQWRKFAPNELKENPQLYAELLANEKRSKPTFEEKKLDWYRKNDPETLKENPELYKELLTQKTQ